MESQHCSENCCWSFPFRGVSLTCPIFICDLFIPSLQFVCYWFKFCVCGLLLNRHHAIILHETAPSHKILVPTAFFWPHHKSTASAMASHHTKISGHKGKDSILTSHLCSVCLKDFITGPHLSHYQCTILLQALLSISHGMPIDNLVLPPNVPPMFQHPGDHSSDDEDDGYHPIHATSTDGKEASFNNDDTWPANDYDMKKIRVLVPTKNLLQTSLMVILESMQLATPPPSPTRCCLLLKLLTRVEHQWLHV